MKFFEKIFSICAFTPQQKYDYEIKNNNFQLIGILMDIKSDDSDFKDISYVSNDL